MGGMGSDERCNCTKTIRFGGTFVFSGLDGIGGEN